MTSLGLELTSRLARRQALIHWIVRDFTHAFTLAPNRFDALSFAGLEKLFSRFALAPHSDRQRGLSNLSDGI